MPLAALTRSTWRLLTFRSTREELFALDHRHLIAGLTVTLLVGMGRHWDAYAPTWVERLGLESLLYVAGLGFLSWLLFLPLAPAGWSLLRVVAFVSLTAPPGVVEAIPVSDFMSPWQAEDFTSPGEVERVNAWLEGLVAAWRTALLVWFLTRSGLHWLEAAISGLLSADLILIALARFNVYHPISDRVNGMRSLDVFAIFAVLALAPLALAYVGVVVRRFVARRRRTAVPAG
jgi:hypothetical protein